MAAERTGNDETDAATSLLHTSTQRNGPATGDREHELAARETNLESMIDTIDQQLRRARNQAEEALEQQNATAEILRAISSSPDDSQPVFDAIVRTGLRLFAGAAISIALPDGDRIRAAAVAESDPDRAQAWRNRFPLPATREFMHGVAILDSTVVDVPDVRNAPEKWAVGARNFLASGYLAITIMPLLRGGKAIGALSVVRTEPGPLSAKQHAALRTFTEQAVIAIENARLFNEIRESLEQQTASGEVLHVISSSIGDTAPVFDKIIESCQRLFAGRIVGMNMVGSDGLIRIGAFNGAGREQLEEIYPLPIAPTNGSAIAILERRVVHYPDVGASDVPAATQQGCRAIGIKSVIFAPLLWEGRGIGAIFVGRDHVSSFSDKEIALLKTFADQAAIGIENARMFRELEQRNQEVSEALDHQTASAEVLRVISSSIGDTTPVFGKIIESCGKLFAGRIVGLNLVDAHNMIQLGAYQGPGREQLEKFYPLPLAPTSASAIAILERRVVHYPDVENGAEVPSAARQMCHITGFKSLIAAPLVWEGRGIGALFVGRDYLSSFSDKEIALLKTFADQAVIGIENARLFRELQQRNREVSEALEQQTATSEILRVISRSPTDIQPVFDTVAKHAARLCEAPDVVIVMAEGQTLRFAASVGQFGQSLEPGFAIPIDRGSVAGRAFLERRTVHIADLAAESDDEYPKGKSLQRRYGHRTMVAVPLLRGDTALGDIVVIRKEVSPFSDKQIALLQTFADQAVIAIENVRLFNETKEALDQQRASSEVLTAISNSIADTKPVFDVILQSCQRLFASETVGMTLLRADGMLEIGAYAGPGEAELRRVFPRTLDRETSSGRAILDQRVQAYADVDAGEMPEASRAGAHAIRLQSMAFAPMSYGGRGIGTLWIGRTTKGPFSDTQLALLTTFADQAVIAIQNARLFNETREALEHRTATSDVLQVISGSMADATPVFEKILDSCERLLGATDLGVFLVDEQDRLCVGAFRGSFADVVPGNYPRPLAGTMSDQVIRSGTLRHWPDVEHAPDVPGYIRDVVRVGGNFAVVVAPLMWEGRGIGTIDVMRRPPRPYSDKELALLATFAEQAVIAIQNARLFNETHESLERQTATADILRVISSSPTSTEPVFDAILDSGARLTEADFGMVVRCEAGAYRAVSTKLIPDPAFEAFMREPRRWSPKTGLGRMEATKQPVNIPDLMDDAAYRERDPARMVSLELGGVRSWLGVPMLREGELIGGILVYRKDVRPFDEHQTRLLQTFADQAVIAIENVRLFNELREKSVQLELASRHKSEFLANMSHELRTPLNAIIGFTRIVMRRSQEQLETKQYENLEKILQSGQNLLALINSILDLAKVEAGHVEVHPGDIELAPLLNDCVRTIEPLLDETKVVLVKAFDSALPRLYVDEEKLRQIVINLLSNAAKFTARGSIRVATALQEQSIAISVTDTGIGIPADKIELIFEEFEQVDASSTRVHGGTGLGLAIARRLARLMGGDIEAASTQGEGSTFTLTLPRRYAGSRAQE